MKYSKSKTSHYKLNIKLFMPKMNEFKKDELSAETFSTPRTLYIQVFFFKVNALLQTGPQRESMGLCSDFNVVALPEWY